MINQILDFEQQQLTECIELLTQFDDKAKELGVEIRPTLSQVRAVNHHGLVENHDWSRDMWLPKSYHSSISCYIYKDGQMLARRTSDNYTSYFVGHYWLLAGQEKDFLINDEPLRNFDLSIENLLESVAAHFQE